MKNAAIVVLTVLLAIVGLLAYRQTTALKTQVQEANAKLAARTASDSLDLQAKCAKQAAEAFKHFGQDKIEAASYRSHYNAPLGACFIEMTTSDLTDRLSQRRRVVANAFEFSTTGFFSAINSIPLEQGDPVVSCYATLPSGEQKKCTSEAEFLTLIKPYMER
jgi:hypothetical protein